MYTNPGEWKKQRDKKLQLAHHICEDCGEEAKDVHHIDLSKSNHALGNLKALCKKCHKGTYHKGSKVKKDRSQIVPVKFSRVIKHRRDILGMTQEQLSSLTSISIFRIGELERGDKDNILLEELCQIGKALQINKVKAWIELDKEIS